MQSNIVLIGMPGAGKSTVGVLLAKLLVRPFIDTDILLQTREGAPLQTLIDRHGPETFCDMEQRTVCDLTADHAVIATGGSVVYRQRSMDYLRANGFVVHLHASLQTITTRLTDIDRRGVVLPRHHSLKELFAEREPLYHRYAHATVACDGRTHNQVISAILDTLPKANAD